MASKKLLSWTLTGLLATGLVASAQVVATGPAAAAPGGGSSGGAGARIPFTEYEAEQGTTNATVIGPDRAYGTLAAEAVGRQAVQLDGKGEYVEFTLRKAANAVNVRYSIPDTADGRGRDASLGVYVKGRRVQSLALTSRYSWYYGQFPWTNNPADGGRRQLYDDSRVLLGATLPAGTKVRLQVGSVDTSPSYVIDVADFEKVAPAGKAPRRALSVVDFGADRSGTKDSSDAIQAALDVAQGTGRTVWIPKGTFKVTRHLRVDRVSVRGAGPWYSMLTGEGVGVYGGYNPTPSSDVHLADFAIFGEVAERIDADQLNAIGGALNDSTVDNVWMQHTKVGVWLDGPMDNFKLSRSRILDQTADGLNFHQGVTNSTVVDTYVRSTGDDGLAMWSEKDPNVNNTFTRNTVKVPVLANNIAIYGGSDIKVTHNLVTDTVTQGGGIQIANRFGSVPLAGTTTVAGNELVRTGSLDLFSHIGNGALWFWAGDAPLTGKVNVRDNLIADSSYEAIQFYGQPVGNVTFDRNTIAGAGTFAVQLNTSGSATFRRTVASGIAAGVYDCDSGFTLVNGRGNRGWDDTTCGYPAPGALQVTNLGNTLQFTSDELGKASDAQTVTIHNPTAEAVRIASVTVTGAFTVFDTCGPELAAGASCTATVAFVPTARGDRGGALTISDGTPAGRYQVYVRGQLIASTVGNLAAGRPVTSSSEIAGCCIAAHATDSNTDTYWESANNAFPQTLTVDLGSAVDVNRVAFKTNAGWGGRTQTFEVLASSDGQTFATVVPAAQYAFDPGTNNNTVTINLPGTVQYRYLRVEVTGNTGWPAAQIAEFEAYATTG
jgi:hypothetical protein